MRQPPEEMEVETYTPERVAEFLLTNSVDVQDYARAVEEVRRIGLDPERIDHPKPEGVRFDTRSPQHLL